MVFSCLGNRGTKRGKKEDLGVLFWLAFEAFGADEGFGVDDAFGGADLIDDDVADGVDVFGLDFDEDVVFSEEGVDFDDFWDAGEVFVDCFFVEGADAEECESGCHG